MSRADFITVSVAISLMSFAFGYFVIAPRIVRALDRRRGGFRPKGGE